ncbi:hypothetical protein [Burkholderia ubonensis]|uniref:hypothetical protein n=1 Tax=Burkholderia ubonensis TaxID=101571 RepID=UPI001E3DDBC4|nr:hypothetical protein [Burkholderia ubonensis]
MAAPIASGRRKRLATGRGSNRKTKEAVHAQPPPSDRHHTPRVVFTLPRFLALSLALGATGPSAWISLVAGVERSGKPGERFGWATVALVVLLVAHLLPALTRGDRWPVRLPAALQMLERALNAGVPCGWATGDEVYGGDRRLRLWLKSREQPFVFAGIERTLWWQGPTYVREDRIAENFSGSRLATPVGGRGRQRRVFV